MKVAQHISFTRFLAQVVFLLLPTSLLVLFILWNSNQYFSILREQWLSQTIYFTSGMLISFFIAQFRFRFLPLFLCLLALSYSGYKLLDNYAFGEFDSFFISVQFLVFSYLFGAGWLVGWGLKRVSFFPILLSGIFLLVSIYLIAKTGNLTTPEKLIQYLTPVVLFSIYMIYTNESLRNTEHTNAKFWWQFGKRLLLFCGLILALFGSIVYLMYPQIKERVEEYGGGGKEGENQMLETKKDGTVQNKESMGMGSKNQRNKNPEPLFCAHIDNFLPGSEIPNPLYLTSYHFTKFDTLTETFERDTTLPFSDEFQPDPSKIQLFSTLTDSSRILQARSKSHRKTVEIEVYKKRLSASAFLAPSTSFWVQPITVEKEFQKEFSSAYRAKSYVSDLNSAYFIYNTDNPDIVQFQQHRFEELRKAKSYNEIDPAFLKYYTFFPSSNQYARIKQLGDSLAQGKNTTIDKVLSVRDYFTHRNALGEKDFSYTDNPGIPGLPGASKLMYFLFESKKGYCAYYAGATVFILRAMGIPCRVVTGFLTVDRSDKNTGWYWFYEDQSHGWVQVYFPEYGWIDFDTTVGNDDAQQSPTPDGTPPMQPPKPLLALGGDVLDIDTIKKTMEVHVRNLIFKDVEYKNVDDNLSLDLRVANIWKDSIKLDIRHIQKGNQVMCVSYAEKLKAYDPEKKASDMMAKLPSPSPIDEVYLKSKEEANKKDDANQQKEDKPLTYYIKHIAMTVLTFILLLFALPITTYSWYKFKIRRSKNSKQKSYYTYKASTFLLHQLNIQRNNLTPYQFAQKIVDPQFHTQFTSFMNVYLKTKYANQTLNATEEKFIQNFFDAFEPSIRSQFRISKRLFSFLHLNRFIQYFYLSEPETTS